MHACLLLSALLVGVLALTPPARAQAALQPAGAPVAEAEAVLLVANRDVAVLRARFLGVSPHERARRAQSVIEQLLARSGPGQVSVQQVPQGKVLLIDGAMALVLTPDDADTLQGQSLDELALTVQARLGQAIAETQEGRDRGRLLRALLHSLLATLAMLMALWLVWWLRRRLVARLLPLIETKAAAVRVAGAPLLHSGRLLKFSHWATRALAALLYLLIAYEWLSYVLTRFPYTRSWGEQLDAFLLGLVGRVGGGVLQAVPDLTVALLVFVLARAVVSAVEPIFERVHSGRASFSWMDRDMARPTKRLVAAGIWLFAIAMAYPYLPGAQSEAFKGISVLVGLMVTLGGSSLVGQAASGLILMYSRTLRVGEYVRIGDQEGTVHELGTFTTKIRTGMGEELTLPNALILGTVTRNYSRTVSGPGYIVDTVVTIGYDTPWRQVEAMLIEAAQRTPGVLETPSPRVLQTALSDFYVEYRLLAQAVPSQPRPRAEILHMLHAHIQDVFNEHHVQIMSPHYLGDPELAKMVPRKNWYAPPARPPEGG